MSTEKKTSKADTYKGYRFQPGHIAIRKQGGEIVSTETLMAAANAATDEGAEGMPKSMAVEILDWLIGLEYGYLEKV